MSVAQNAVASIAMLVIGAIKTWLHVGSVPVLRLSMCSGQSISIPLDSSNLVDHWHCWGCYLIVAGLALAARVIWQTRSPRSAPTKVSD